MTRWKVRTKLERNWKPSIPSRPKVGDPILVGAAPQTRQGGRFFWMIRWTPVTPDGVKAMLETLREAKIYGYKVRVFASDIDPHSLKGCTVEGIDFDSDNI